MFRLFCIFVVLLVAYATSAISKRAIAEGALAVGLPKDVAADGFSYGASSNYGSVEAARANAMEHCKSGRLGPDSGAVTAKRLCRIVETFRDKCVSIAMDPEDATPGVGWGIGDTKNAADRLAIENCMITAGASRRNFCQVSHSRCDGSAK